MEQLQLGNITLLNCDCVEYMRTLPDNAFDLAICDPPYGDALQTAVIANPPFGDSVPPPPTIVQTTIPRRKSVEQVRKAESIMLTDGGLRGTRRRERESAAFWYGPQDGEVGEILQSTEEQPVSRTGGTWAAKYGAGVTGRSIVDWDIAPTEDYFNELFRVSKNQIIWGANYFPMPPTRCFVVWRKLTIGEQFSMAMAEYAWTSFNANAKVFECMPQGDRNDPRFHPTQKPVKLYEWLLKNYANDGDKILDTHGGSMSSMIACHRMGFTATCCELDEYYFSKAVERLKKEQQQLTLF